MGLLVYAEVFNPIKKRTRRSLLITALVLVGWSFVNLPLDQVYYLVVVLAILLAEIIYVTSLYYSLNVDEERKSNMAQLPDDTSQ